MRNLLITLTLTLAASVADAQSVVANHAIPSRAIITSADVRQDARTFAGAHTSPEDVIGLEARVTIYPGRPIRLGDVGPPALVERNQIVTLRYHAGGVFIETDGRALDRAGVGDLLRVMNLSSRTTITGRVHESGIIEVGK